jgi:hypothetical protein
MKPERHGRPLAGLCGGDYEENNEAESKQICDSACRQWPVSPAELHPKYASHDQDGNDRIVQGDGHVERIVLPWLPQLEGRNFLGPPRQQREYDRQAQRDHDRDARSRAHPITNFKRCDVHAEILSSANHPQKDPLPD